MKLSSVRHLTGEGFKNVWDNRLMSLASIGVLVSCMVLIGAAMLVSFNVDRAMTAIQQENVIMAYLNDYNSVRYSDKYINASSSKSSSAASSAAASAAATASATASGSTASAEKDKSDVPYDDYLIHNDEEAKVVCDELKKLPNIESVEYISADEGIERLVGMINEEQAKYIAQLQEDGDNPLPAAAKITLTDISKFDESLQKIKGVAGVYSVTSQRDLAKKVTTISNAVTTASYIIIVMLMVIALVIVCNTIRVTMFNRKLEISIMKAVGATDAFIRLPFVVEGIVIGLISAVITLGLLYVGYSAVLRAMVGNIQNPVPYSDHVLLFAGIFAGVGVLSGFIGSMFMINKYLKREGSEFSALS